MEDVVVPIFAISAVLIGLPWLIMHYITKWRQAPSITDEDEKLLDEMFVLARRLEERLNTVERIVAADNPDFRPGLSGPGPDPKPGLTGPAPEWKPSLSAPQSDFQIDRRN